MSDNTAYKMVQEAVRLFCTYYGDYPQKIGLDRITRHREYYEHHGPEYRTIEIDPVERLKVNIFGMDLNDLSTPLAINYHRINIPVEQLVCTTYDGIPFPSPNSVWCQWGDTTARMSIWFTERGQHSIIWDEESWVELD